MRRSSTSALSLAALLAVSFLPVTAAAQVATTAAAGPQRFVDIIELTDHDDQADITIIFTCSVRYVSHLPASEGRELRIELQPQSDCNVSSSSQIAGELPHVVGR